MESRGITMSRPSSRPLGLARLALLAPLAFVVVTSTGCFFEFKAGYSLVTQTPAVAEPSSTGHGISLRFSVGAFIDPGPNMLAVSYPFYSRQNASGGEPVGHYADHAIEVRVDHSIGQPRRKFEFVRKIRLTLALAYGKGGSYDRADGVGQTRGCTIGSGCPFDSDDSYTVRAFGGYTYQLGIPGGLFGEGVGLSVGPAFQHWGGDGPLGGMKAYGVEFRLHSALLYKMVGGAKKDSAFWDAYTPSRPSTPVYTPDPVKQPSYDRQKNPLCDSPACY